MGKTIALNFDHLSLSDRKKWRRARKRIENASKGTARLFDVLKMRMTRKRISPRILA